MNNASSNLQIIIYNYSNLINKITKMDFNIIKLIMFGNKIFFNKVIIAFKYNNYNFVIFILKK